MSNLYKKYNYVAVSVSAGQVHNTTTLLNIHQHCSGEEEEEEEKEAQSVGPEFKPQYCKKKKRKENIPTILLSLTIITPLIPTSPLP
jgi:hypothetical protein